MTTGFEIDGKVAIVTGATRGIGRAVALALARSGAVVVPTGRRQVDLDDLNQEAVRAGLEVHPILLDVTDAASLGPRVKEVASKFGHIDILVNNAGLGNAHSAFDVSESDWDEMMAVNLRGLFFMSQAVARAMADKGEGRIINMSSQASFVGLRDAAVYCTSKGGVNMMTKVLAVEWAPLGITVNAVAPTFVYTPGTAPILDDPGWRLDVMSKIPLGKLATPDDVTAAVVYLSSAAGRMVTGTILQVDGGWTAQ
jgi:NAD(P)-dependent dehydrogenase (short-subunit alcohol dehydrogenase family)